MATNSIPARLFERREKNPNKPAYSVREGGVWKSTDWRTYATQVEQAARALIAAGVGPGDTVNILGFNRPEWVILDLAAMCVGAAPAGIYTTCSPEEVGYIVSHSEAKVVLVEDTGQWEKIEEILGGEVEGFTGKNPLPKLKHVVTMKGVGSINDDLVSTWEEFLATGDPIDAAKVHERIAALKPDQLATLIYTSGTTGPPKGVMLSHENLTFTADVAKEVTGIQNDDSALSYLPLSHIAEQMFSIHLPVSFGGQTYFAEAIDKVPDNLKEVQPTVFFGVPRIWEKFHAAIDGKMRGATGAKAKLLAFARKTATEVNQGRAHGKEPSGFLAFKYSIAKKLIFSKLHPAIGLGNVRLCASGAAPIAKEVLEFFASLDLVVLEVYGQSEDTGPTSFNTPNRFRLGTVGPALPGVKVEIREDDEIVVKGKNVFLGYYKDKKATDATLIDGWLHSGDLGAFDSEGFLSITGRKKDIIITAGGKNIAPKNIEAALKNHEIINEAVVIGDKRKYLSALVTLDPDATPAWMTRKSLTADEAHKSEEIRAEIQAWVDKTNQKFARVEQIKKFTVLHRNLTVEDGELTPTLKVKRNRVNDHFADEIEAMYQ